MKTVYYMLTTQDALALGEGLEKAAGGERQIAWVRQPERRTQVRRGGNNVIDLAAWRAERAMEQDAPEGADWLDETDGAWPEEGPELLCGEDEAAARPVRRSRRDHTRRGWLRGELAATLSVAGATAALVLWVLAF